jgi:hypothetical protein
MGMECHVWISITCLETACGRPARVRHLPATTCSSTKVVIRSISICQTVGLAVRIFLATTQTFTKGMALLENGRGMAWHGMCELAFKRPICTNCRVKACFLCTVEPWFMNISHHEQIGSRTNFPKKMSQVTNGVSSNEHASRQEWLATSWEYRRESVSCCVTFAQHT